jgi:glycosyltransferase involved in cell wall biosynthesis
VTRTVVHFTGGLIFGGVEQVLMTTLQGLDPERWHSVLYYYADADIAPLLEGARSVGVETHAFSQPANEPALIRAIRLSRVLRSEQAAIFHAHLSMPEYCRLALIAAALARIPLIVATEHLFKVRPSRRALLYQRIVSACVDRYIAVSHHVARRLREYLLIPARKITVIHNGIPLEPLKYAAGEVPFAAATNGRPIVFSAARLHEQKGLMQLIEAAGLVPEAVFVVAGDGPQRIALEDRARSLGLNDRVLFLGHRSDVPALLASCDVFVLPSLFEGLPLAILEAMWAGKPVIASAVGGVGEAILHGETGLLVPPGQPEHLANAIRTLICNPAFARQLAIAAKAHVEQEFSADTMVQGVVRTYDELLSVPRFHDG